MLAAVAACAVPAIAGFAAGTAAGWAAAALARRCIAGFAAQPDWPPCGAVDAGASGHAGPGHASAGHAAPGLAAAAALAARPGCRTAAALGVGVLAAALACRHGPGPYAAAVLCALALLLALALVDAALGLLPDALTQPLLWLGLVRAWAGGGIGPVPLHDAVAGAVCGYGLPWLLSQAYLLFFRRAGMGQGDLKLLAALGAWVGVRPLPGVLLAACVAGVAWAFLWRRDFRLGASYPFGPFLAAGGAVALLLGPEVHWGFG